MTSRHSSQLYFAIALILPCLPASSQDLTVFQDDSLASGQGQVFGGALPAGGLSMAPDLPAFVLKGIYRFGDEYHVSLLIADGATQTVTWHDDDNEAVSVASGYLIAQVSPREVTFELPAGINCQSSMAGGASCVGRSQMVLTFSETTATPASAPSTPGGQQNGGAVDAGQGGQFGRGGGNDVGALFEAANEGDEEAAAALQEFFGNRGGGAGRGGRGGGGGRGGAGRGGAGVEAGDETGAGNGGAPQGQ